jgi:hypothetical protein
MLDLKTAFPVLLSVALLGACANYATLQEPETIPRGHQKTGVAVTATTYKLDAGDSLDKVTVPAVNVWYRRGLLDKLEAHASAWIPLGASVGAKYQLTGNGISGLAVSVGLDFGYLQLTAKNEDDDTEYKQTIVDTYVPVYVGYRVGPGFALYSSPKYILRTSSGDGGTAFGHLAGGTVGVVVGSRTQFLLEGTAMYDITVKAPAFQGGIGVAF